MDIFYKSLLYILINRYHGLPDAADLSSATEYESNLTRLIDQLNKDLYIINGDEKDEECDCSISIVIVTLSVFKTPAHTNVDKIRRAQLNCLAPAGIDICLYKLLQFQLNY
jgi:hypothetical protein